MYTNNIQQSFKNNLYLIFLFILFSADCYSQISFAPYKTYSTGSWASVVCIGDVNNDGLNDVVLGTGFYFDTTNDYKIFVYLQDNSGNLMPPIKYSYSNSYPGLTSISIADLNNDGLNDVAIGFGNNVGIFYQNTTNTLNPVQTYTCGNSIDGISTGDLNHDGLTDIVVSQWGATNISILYQKSTGGFTLQSYPAPSGGYDQIDIGDVNNDQLDDVVLMLGQLQGGVHVYTQNNSGTLNNYVSYINIPDMYGSLGGIAIGNLNTDTLNDVVKAVYGNSPYARIAILFQDQTTNLLQTPVLIPAYDCPEPVRINDLNCDGKNEIIVAHGGWDALTVYEQDKNGNYNTYTKLPLTYASHYQPQGMSVGDINHDGKKDVVIADYNSGLVVLLNQSKNYGHCCRLPVKPVLPKGDTLVCVDGKSSVYKSHVTPTDQATWNLFPPEAGTIFFSNHDSCQIKWNNTWRGKSGIFVTTINSCSPINSDTLFVISNRLPILNLGNDTTLCTNSTLKLYAGKGFTNYAWQDNSKDSVYLVNNGGIYYLKAGNSCGNKFDTIKVTSVSLPKIDLKDTVWCPNANIQLNVAKPGFNKYLWQDNSTNPSYTISGPGNYSVSVTDVNNCKSNQSFSVEKRSIPIFYLPHDTAFCDIINFTLDVSYPNATYLWQDGSNYPKYNIKTEGNYSVTVTNICGSTKDSVVVKLKDCQSYLDVPSAFSPNEDGLNDVLYAVGTNVENIKFTIFDRWGQKVFETNNLLIGWDGTLNGKKMNTAVFIYIISATSTIDGHLIQKHGNISLIR